MPLASGSYLGPYEIKSLLGSGGMGEVYRARDTKLNRDVALKILPEAFALDPDRLARFKREAQVLASLNHPNIAAIYGFEQAAGVQALVLELVEGPTLAEVIAERQASGSRLQAPEESGPGSARAGAAQRDSEPGRKPAARSPKPDDARTQGLPMDEALSIAHQLCDALEAAHEQGIVHRDLKPANIKLKVRGAPPPRTEDGHLERTLSAADVADGTVKVLDFGLAKALDDVSGGVRLQPDLTASPTITSPAATRVGVILGTAAYMSPEQARGKVVDKRADIWAFGVVLYEMLTGRRAFEGEAVTETLGAVIHKEPTWSALPAGTPPRIVELLRRCLKKDARDRLRDIGDARIAMDEALTAVAAVPMPGQTPRVATRERVALALASIALVAALPFVVLHLREALPASQTVRFTIQPPEDAAFTGGAAYAPAQAVSPDGRLIVFRAQRSGGPSLLWVRALDALAARALPGTENGDFPFWSPDSRFIAFFAQGKLKKIEVSGGPVQTLCDAPAGEGGTWNRDGTILFAPTDSSGLFRVSAAGGTPAPVTNVDAAKKEQSHRWPWFLPDGRHFLFLIEPGNAVSVGSLDSSETRRLLNTDSKALYMPPGYIVFVRQGTLLAQPFDASRAEPTGEAVPIAEQVRFSPVNGRAAVSVSENGVLAYRSEESSFVGTPVWVDRNGHELTPLVPAPLDHPEFPRLSPDGRRLALTVARDLWVYDLEGRPPIKLTFDGGHFAPLWTPDGQRIVYESINPAPLRSVAADGSGGTPELVSPEGHYHPHGWSSDGREMVVARLDGGASAPDIFRLPAREKGEPQVVVQTPAAEGAAGAALSPDGRWLAYASNVTGQNETWVRPYPGPGAPIRVSPNGGVEPVWARHGRELYYLEGNRLMSVAVETGSAFNFKPPILLFESSYVRGGQPPSYDVAPDGRFLMIKSASAQTTTAPITVVVNWAAGLKK